MIRIPLLVNNSILFRILRLVKFYYFDYLIVF